MPAIGNLERIRGTFCRPIGITARTVTAHNADGGILLEPGCERVGGPIRQHINRLMPFKIDDQRSIVVAFAKGEVVDPNALRAGWCLVGSSPHEAEERVAARWRVD